MEKQFLGIGKSNLFELRFRLIRVVRAVRAMRAVRASKAKLRGRM